MYSDRIKNDDSNGRVNYFELQPSSENVTISYRNINYYNNV
jgi:hypothetical protein